MLPDLLVLLAIRHQMELAAHTVSKENSTQACLRTDLESHPTLTKRPDPGDRQNDNVCHNDRKAGRQRDCQQDQASRDATTIDSRAHSYSEILASVLNAKQIRGVLKICRRGQRDYVCTISTKYWVIYVENGLSAVTKLTNGKSLNLMF